MSDDKQFSRRKILLSGAAVTSLATIKSTSAQEYGDARSLVVEGVPITVFPEQPIDYNIALGDLSISGNQVRLATPGIATNLARYSDLVRAELGAQPSLWGDDIPVVTLLPEQITISDDGTVIIDNADYVDSLTIAIEAATERGDTNFCCSPCNVFNCSD